MLKIIKVNKKSVARDYGFEIGDAIISANGRQVSDFIDLVYIDGEEVLDLTVLSKSGDTISVRIEKEYGEPLGIEILDESPIYRCKNKCSFCFVDQLPKGMRDTLYVKDDDWRYSLMCGNYVTLTNVTDDDIDKIIAYKISPLYISVHAYDDQVRLRLVKNPNTLNLIDYIRKLGESGIKLHTQVVMCKGINDGEVLRETIDKLSKMDYVETIAIVPVGLTKHRTGLEKLDPIDKDTASKTIDIVEDFYSRGVKVWCSDEMYLRAQRDIRDYDYYEEFLQIENGVGLIAKFRHDFGLTSKARLKSGSYGVVTGVSAYSEMSNACKLLGSINPLLNITVYPIVNDFFGHTVTVAGLLTGVDIVNQLKDKTLPDILVLPSVMFREQTDITLDGMSVKKLEKEIGRKIIVADSDGAGFVKTFSKR